MFLLSVCPQTPPQAPVSQLLGDSLLGPPAPTDWTPLVFLQPSSETQSYPPGYPDRTRKQATYLSDDWRFSPHKDPARKRTAGLGISVRRDLVSPEGPSRPEARPVGKVSQPSLSMHLSGEGRKECIAQNTTTRQASRLQQLTCMRKVRSDGFFIISIRSCAVPCMHAEDQPLYIPCTNILIF